MPYAQGGNALRDVVHEDSDSQLVQRIPQGIELQGIVILPIQLREGIRIMTLLTLTG